MTSKSDEHDASQHDGPCENRSESADRNSTTNDHKTGRQHPLETGLNDKQVQHSMQSERIKQQETDFRNQTTHTGICSPFNLFFINWYSAILVFVFYLLSLESLVSIALSVILTVVTYYRTDDSTSFNGGTMNWILLSFAVITPMSSSISMAFNRRERALADVAAVKSTLRNLYMAHACWDWSRASKIEPTGRAACDVDWLHQSDEALHAICRLCEDLTRLLTLPSTSRARHRVTAKGRTHAEEGSKLTFYLHRSTLKELAYLSQLCEELKRQGLPPNEATRLRQWERMVNERLESLKFVKQYRTPQALRSFSRLFSVVLPPFYAPYYADLARQLNSLSMAVSFSVLTAVALTSLFESLTQMEDPFVGLIGLDGIDVRDELICKFYVELLDMREEFYPEAAPFVRETKRGLSASLGSSGLPELRLFVED